MMHMIRQVELLFDSLYSRSRVADLFEPNKLVSTEFSVNAILEKME